MPAKIERTTMLASELMIDFNLYPRHAIDSTHVNDLLNALKAGAKLPPVVINQQDKRVVDGFHRLAMYKKAAGANAEVPCEARRYRNDAEMFLDAVRMNAAHGRKLAPYDRARIVILADELKIDEEQIAAAMHVQQSSVAHIREARIATNETGEPTELKATTEHLAGHALSDRQIGGVKRAGGMSVIFYVNQILNAIESGILNESDAGLMKRLGELHAALGRVLAKRKAD
jgi:hypothetical protein